MKTSHYILVLFMLLSVSFLKVTAQQVDENTKMIEKYFENINSEQILLDQDNTSSKIATNFKSLTNSELNILQKGNFNLVNIKANISNLSVNQIGNSNNYEFLSYYGRNDLTFEVQQIGDNNLVQVLGENSIMDKMKIIQKSNAKTITITNY